MFGQQYIETQFWIYAEQWDGVLVFLCSTLRIWNNGACEEVLEGHTGPVQCLIILPSGEIASGSGDCTIRIWGSGTSKVLTGHTDTVRWSILCIFWGFTQTSSLERKVKKIMQVIIAFLVKMSLITFLRDSQSEKVPVPFLRWVSQLQLFEVQVDLVCFCSLLVVLGITYTLTDHLFHCCWIENQGTCCVVGCFFLNAASWHFISQRYFSSIVWMPDGTRHIILQLSYRVSCPKYCGYIPLPFSPWLHFRFEVGCSLHHKLWAFYAFLTFQDGMFCACPHLESFFGICILGFWCGTCLRN